MFDNYFSIMIFLIYCCNYRDHAFYDGLNGIPSAPAQTVYSLWQFWIWFLQICEYYEIPNVCNKISIQIPGNHIRFTIQNSSMRKDGVTQSYMSFALILDSDKYPFMYTVCSNLDTWSIFFNWFCSFLQFCKPIVSIGFFIGEFSHISFSSALFVLVFW